MAADQTNIMKLHHQRVFIAAFSLVDAYINVE